MPRRHDGLMPLTHDHHHALAHARRLRLAASEGPDELLREAREFLDFFHNDTLIHFREEEEVVFPLAIEDERAAPLLGRVVMEHLRIHALVARLSEQVTGGNVHPESASDLATALEAHVRVEEKELFPLLEEVVADEELKAISLRPRERSSDKG